MIAVPAARYAAEIEAWVRFACPVSTETQGGDVVYHGPDMPVDSSQHAAHYHPGLLGGRHEVLNITGDVQTIRGSMPAAARGLFRPRLAGGPQGRDTDGRYGVHGQYDNRVDQIHVRG